MISGVIPGIVANRDAFEVARSPINSGKEDFGRPSGKAAAAILLPKMVDSFELKTAVSVSVRLAQMRESSAYRSPAPQHRRENASTP